MSQDGRVHVIACGVLAIDIERIAERLAATIRTEYLPGGLHSRPGELRARLQEAIDRASDRGDVRRIAVGYGICGRGTVGLRAGPVPLAVPKVHDCISLFLGSDAAYRGQFARWPGTYYISAGWFEEKVEPKPQADDADRPPPKHGDYDRLVATYGRENADAVVHFLNSWKRNYQRAAFIDTGSGRRGRYAEYARAMAAECGWRYEQIPGDLSLLTKLLTAETSGPEVLVVPPGYVTHYDPLSAGLTAVPPEGGAAAAPLVVTGAAAPVAIEQEGSRPVQVGLGIDAGGTYTDVVLYDFSREAVAAKAKALTTRWDYTVGIDNALAQIPPERMEKVDLAAVSTTLATNAIVEGRGQTVGLLLMPPPNAYDPSDVPHEPKAVLSARMRIDGREITSVDADEVRRVGRRMVREAGVEAFAVSGFAGTINPAHELAVKQALREGLGLSVTCGHELSELLNFRTRAATAVLNARIIPHLAKFLTEAEAVLRRRRIHAPMMVVKGDGSLTSVRVARDRPVETILSGPAASVAGARRLTRADHAFVVDMGGTTTDTAALAGGAVRTCAGGARVGGWKTHVQALDMRTIALGGDSLIAYEKRSLRIGPRRVAPIAWAASACEAVRRSLDYLQTRLEEYAGSTRPMEMLWVGGRRGAEPLEPAEEQILAALRERPLSLAELAERTGADHWSLLRVGRLESRGLVQRFGLTPTDLLHRTGRFRRWDEAAAGRLCEMVSCVAGREPAQFIEEVMGRIIRGLVLEVVKKQLDEQIDPDAMENCPACRALMDNLVRGGSQEYRLRLRLNRPIIGVGAPVHAFLPEAARLLETEAIIPPHADVANAVGAITSSVRVHRQLRIRPNEIGRYGIDGLPASPDFSTLEEAARFATGRLRRQVLAAARAAGTSQSRVEIATDDRIGSAADGMPVFLERRITARLSGRPDIARLAGRT